MQTRLKMSREGLELLKEFEGLRLTAARLPDGRWSMGHGHTQYAREGATITAADAEALLVYDLIPVVAAVNDGVVPQISQHQFDALVCFAFNVGVEAFGQSEVLQRVNQARMTEAALAMAIWRSGAFDGRRVVLDALVRRRTAEEALLLGRDGTRLPSDLVRPEIDPAAQASMVGSVPMQVVTDEVGDQIQASLVDPADSVDPDGETSTTGSAADEGATEAAGGSETDGDVGVAAAAMTGLGAALVTAAPGVDAGEAAPEILESSPETGSEGDDAGADIIGADGTKSESGASEADVEEPAPTQTDGALPFGTQAWRGGVVASASHAERIYVSPGLDLTTSAAAEVLETQGPALEETTGLAEPPSFHALIDEPPTILVLTPPPEVIVEPASRADTAPVLAGGHADVPLFDGGPEAAPSSEDSVIYYEPEDDLDDRASRWSDTGAYITTGIVGLAAFGFGIAGFQLAGQEQLPAGTFDEKTAIAWVLVAIGVVCVWVSAYNLFKRLGVQDETT